MARVVERSNLAQALKRVRQNQGSAGIDGMTVDELLPYLKRHWSRIREELLAGRYQPSALRRHQISKAGGGMRTLGIADPVLDLTITFERLEPVAGRVAKVDQSRRVIESIQL